MQSKGEPLVKHIVLLKLKEMAEGKSKAENARMLKREIESLVGRIPVIRKLEVGLNFNQAPDAYDLALDSEFGTKEDLDMYQNHPEHQRVIGILRRVMETRIVVDYEF